MMSLRLVAQYAFHLFLFNSIQQSNAFPVQILLPRGVSSTTITSIIVHPSKPIQWLRSNPLISTTKLLESNNKDRDGTRLVGKSDKTFEEKRFIQECLAQNELFATLPKFSIDDLLNAFEKIQLSRDEVLFNQGDSPEGDYVYLIAGGKFTIKVDGKVLPEPYGTLSSRAIIGELGALYDQPRAATVIVQSETATVYRIGGNTFQDILKKQMKDLKKMKRIDDAINDVEGAKTLYFGKIIPPYQPERLWLWKQIDGTILSLSLKTTLIMVLSSLVFVIYMKYLASENNNEVFVWSLDDIFQYIGPEKDLPIVQNLALVNKIWQYQKNLTTFVLTFFLSQAFSFWREIYQAARSVQDGLDDIHLLLSTNLKRNDDGTFTAESQSVMEDVGQFSRLFHIFLWASLAQRYEVLTTPAGLERMASRRLLTPKQLDVLEGLNLPGDQLFFAPLEWMMIRINQSIGSGLLPGYGALHGSLNSKVCTLRTKQADIQSALAGRMPLAYVHLVQILVDTFILIAPLALYPDIGAYSPIAVGILTFFYTGSLDLSKVFLDPLNNEKFCEDSIFMDLGILIRESNAGSVRWNRAGGTLPF